MNKNSSPQLKKYLTIYILPGGAGVDKGGWPSWLKKELNKLGFNKTYVCNLRNNNPRLRAIALSKKYSLDRNTVIVGTSLGALTAIKWLEYKKKTIYGLLLVDPSVHFLLELAWKEERNLKVSKELEKYLKSWSWKLNLPLAAGFSKRRVILSEVATNKKFPGWLKAHREYSKLLNSSLKVASGKKSHFTSKKEPEILKALLKIIQ